MPTMSTIDRFPPPDAHVGVPPAPAHAKPDTVPGACAVCRNVDVQPAFRSRDYQLARCRACTHLYVSEPVSKADLAAAYGRDYYEPADADAALGYADYLGSTALRLRGFADRLATVERHAPGRGRLLDYGCAVGLFVKVAAAAGWAATGLDRSEWAADYGRRTFGLDIVVSDGSHDPFAPATFDAISMWDVLEHLESPREVLGSVARWLKPGGVLGLNTVNASSLGARLAGPNWRHLAPPMHLQYFTRDSLHRLLHEFGFRVVSRTSQGVMLTGARPVGAWGRRLPWVERAATHWRTKPLATALNLLDEIDIVAVKI